MPDEIETSTAPPEEVEPKKKSSRKALKICCGVTLLLILVFIIVMVTLTFTLFKPKQPIVIPHPVGLTDLQFTVFPVLALNVTAHLDVTIINRNYGGFKYENTTVFVEFHGEVIAQAAVEHDFIPARGEHNISTVVHLDGDKLLKNPNFFPDFNTGIMNFTSTSLLQGDVIVFKLLKLHAKVQNHCDINIYTTTKTVDSKCFAKLKI